MSMKLIMPLRKPAAKLNFRRNRSRMGVIERRTKFTIRGTATRGQCARTVGSRQNAAGASRAES